MTSSYCTIVGFFEFCYFFGKRTKSENCNNRWIPVVQNQSHFWTMEKKNIQSLRHDVIVKKITGFWAIKLFLFAACFHTYLCIIQKSYKIRKKRKKVFNFEYWCSGELSKSWHHLIFYIIKSGVCLFVCLSVDTSMSYP